MAFDLESSIPVDEPKKAKFDLSSSKPIAEKKDLSESGSDVAKGSLLTAAQTVMRMAPGGEGVRQLVKDKAPIGAVETAAELGSGIAGTIAGGYAGLAGAALPGPEGQGASWAEKVRRKMTYEPRTEVGKAGGSLASLPMEVANKLLGKTGGAAGALVGPRTEAAGQTIGESLAPIAMAAQGARVGLKPMEQRPMMAGRDYSPLREFTPEQAERFNRMKGQGVDPTLGNVTRDPAQVRFEQQTAATEQGKPIYQRTVEQDEALTTKTEGMKPKGATPKMNVDETGRSLRRAIESKKAAADQEVDAAYTRAREAGETKQKVDPSPLTKYLAANEPAAITVPALKSISAKLRQLMGEEEGAVPEPIGSGKISGKIKQKPAEKVSEGISIDDIEFLRQEVGKLGEGGGPTRKYMNDVRMIIDKITEGAGGDLYKQARAKRRAVGLEFEEQEGVAKVLRKKTDTDYAVPGEDVWHNVVVKGSTDDLVNVIRTLRTAGEKQRPQSMQALKDMQAKTIEYIVNEATKTDTFSPTGFKRAVSSIGEEKLAYLIGKDAVAALEGIGQTAKDLKKQPGKVAGSDTAVNIRSMAEKLATDHAATIMRGIMPKPLSLITKIAEGISEKSAKRAETKRLQELIDESLAPHRASMADIAEEAAKTQKERKKYVMGEIKSRSALPALATVRENQ